VHVNLNLPECEWNELLAELERVTGSGYWMLDSRWRKHLVYSCGACARGA